MNTKAVLTGEIVNFNGMEPSERRVLQGTLDQIFKNLRSFGIVQNEVTEEGLLKVELENPVMALRMALLVRYGLAMSKPKEAEIWDVRLAIGLGKINSTLDLKGSDAGEAYSLSRRSLEALPRAQSMIITTPWDELNEEFAVSTLFVDHLVKRTTINQSECMFHTLSTDQTQREIAVNLGKRPQTVNTQLMSAQYRPIEAYLNRFEKLVQRNTQVYG